ncbi:MAG TPA: hypothetical protein PK513_04775 [Alphaproteobacteria bacterium]|nr:hypothetical protein [Alphaproteobacteria bacterium]USO05625.1 MAG: hypothetical protein H6859_10995 [Rhodospirillales bacterium]HOO81794.1 hypothetical protein [Alphaproteobacteria bacterium]
MAERAIDTGIAKALAQQFLKRLVDDFKFGSDVDTMEQVVNGLLPRDDKGKPKFDDASRAQAAKTLITGLNALYKKSDVDSRVQGAIENIFKDARLKTAHDLATQLKDQMRTQEFLALLKNDDADFGFYFNDRQIKAIKHNLNLISPGQNGGPGLGDMIANFLGLRGDLDGTAEPTARSELTEGFHAMTNGGQNSLAKFWDKDRAGDNKAFNVWNPPSGEEQKKAFFSKTGMMNSKGKSEYQHYDSDAKVFKINFEDMILAKWEKDGIVKFNGPYAREHFINFVQNQRMSGELGAPLSAALESKGQISFASGSARADFDEFTSGLAGQGLDNYEIAEAIKKYAEDSTNGVTLPKAGLHKFENELPETISLFQDAKSPDEFADKVLAFANWYPGSGIVVVDPKVEQETPSVMRGKPNDAPAHSKASASKTPEEKLGEIKVVAGQITTPSASPEPPAAVPVISSPGVQPS